MLQGIVYQFLTPDVLSCSVAISACKKGKHWEGALGMLQEVVHQLLATDVMSCSAAISACE